MSEPGHRDVLSNREGSVRPWYQQFVNLAKGSIGFYWCCLGFYWPSAFVQMLLQFCGVNDDQGS